jgi:Subunit ChlI of Mg-chelatase
VDVQVHVGESGGGQFNIVGLADKAVAESRERVRAALAAIGLALPFKRITVNLAPADLPKEGSHYDLPIALGLLAAINNSLPFLSRPFPSRSFAKVRVVSTTPRSRSRVSVKAMLHVEQ